MRGMQCIEICEGLNHRFFSLFETGKKPCFDVEGFLEVQVGGQLSLTFCYYRPMQLKAALFVQFAISTGICCFVFWLLIQVPGQNPKVPIFGALIAGFGGLWAVRLEVCPVPVDGPLKPQNSLKPT